MNFPKKKLEVHTNLKLLFRKMFAFDFQFNISNSRSTQNRLTIPPQSQPNTWHTMPIIERRCRLHRHRHRNRNSLHYVSCNELLGDD